MKQVMYLYINQVNFQHINNKPVLID